MYIHDVGVDPHCIVVLKSKMAAMSPKAVDPVLLFCDTFSHPENEVS